MRLSPGTTFTAVLGAAAAALVLAGSGSRTALSAQGGLPATKATISGPVGPMPYDVVRGWQKPASEPGYTFGGAAGVFAESPDRIFVLQRGEVQLPTPLPPTFAGFAGSIGLNVNQADKRVWRNCLYVVNGEGQVKERWTQWDHLCDGGKGLGPHRVRISPYDPEKRVWVINESAHVIYVFSNDGKKLIKTLGEKNVSGSDRTHFGQPQDVAFLPDGRVLVADGLENHRVIILNRDLGYLSEFGGKGDGPGQFNQVHTVAVAPGNRIIAFDRLGGRVHIFRTSADPTKVEFVESFGGFSIPLDIIVNEDGFWMGDLRPLHIVKLDFSGRHLFTWMVPSELPDGFREIHSFSVDSAGNFYGADNGYGRTQKLVPRAGVDKRQLIGPPWIAR